VYTFYCCALWTFLLLRILNSINYDCPCIHFIFAQYYFQYFANFLHPSFINQGIIFHFANFFIHRSSIRALFYISRIFYSHHWLIRAFCISRMSSIFPLIRAFSHSANILHSSFHRSGLFFAFREYHTSIFSLIRAFSCISRASYIHLFIVQGLFCTFLNLFIHFFHCASIFLHFGHWFTRLSCFSFYPSWCAFVLLFLCGYPVLPLRRICAETFPLVYNSNLSL